MIWVNARLQKAPELCTYINLNVLTMDLNTCLMSCCAVVTAFASVSAQKPYARVENIRTEYRGKLVHAKRLTVSSEIPMPVDTAWQYVQTPALLQFVAKGMIRFKPTGQGFPPTWEQGKTYSANMRFFGLIPSMGDHFHTIEKIDPATRQIATREWDWLQKYGTTMYACTILEIIPPSMKTRS